MRCGMQCAGVYDERDGDTVSESVSNKSRAAGKAETSVMQLTGAGGRGLEHGAVITP